ncbi:acetyl-CoA carboxylase biotin carboxyl carrier protein subunit [Pseudooceanicola sp.]|uniref:acetyl-CoA carboxylase biotin carboxyl carrier protein subunit n=1 Tax=Pseudooceanicola sp. TaxID=1914328 RepID=UPI0035C69057
MRYEIRSDVTGRVWRVLKSEGDEVGVDDPILIVEAMKMEIPVTSDRPGKVVELSKAEGDAVSEDEVVAVLESGE